MSSPEVPRQQERRPRDQDGELETQLRQWLLASLRGDKESYRLFLSRVAQIVTPYLLKSMNPCQRSVQKAEELTQDVLMSIHQKRSTYRPEMPLLPWIYTIARYRLIDSIRREGRRPRTVEWSEEHEQVAHETPPDAGPDIDFILSGLTEKQREVLVLAKVDDLPLAEVATKMKMSLSAVKVTIHRAIRAVKNRQEVEVYDP